MTLSARIYIDSDTVPYKVKRRMPTMLAPYFPGDRDWTNFCDSLDRRLRPFEEIKARWIVLGVLFTVAMIGVLVGIFIRFRLPVVEESDLEIIVSSSLAGSTFLAFTLYYFFMQAWVIHPLKDLGDDLTKFCQELSEKWEMVEFEFQQSPRCTVYWDSNFDARINITVSEPVDGRGV